MINIHKSAFNQLPIVTFHLIGICFIKNALQSFKKRKKYVLWDTYSYLKKKQKTSMVSVDFKWTQKTAGKPSITLRVTICSPESDHPIYLFASGPVDEGPGISETVIWVQYS